ncbi:MAG TPA: IS30 family transposase [Acidimicrobiales bacterium]
MPGKRLALRERRFIEAGRRDGLSLRAIGRELGRAHTTISREIERNRQALNGAYRSVVAEHRTRQRARRPKPFKLSRQRWLARRVERLLVRKWSPEQIAVKLRRDHPDDPRWWVSAEAIYHSLYVQGRGGLKAELTAHLRRQRRARKTGLGPGRLPNAVHISQRPAEAGDRAVPGHWEGDLLLGKAGLSQVGMLTERSTRFTLLFALPTDRTAPTVRDALVKVVASIPTQLRRSLTWDNGKEMAEHRAFSLATDLQVYFCDPGHPWQRGTAENTIGLVRAYLPKGEDLSRYSARQLASFTVMLNERPRHTLDWRSPAEAYADLLAVQ